LHTASLAELIEAPKLCAVDRPQGGLEPVRGHEAGLRVRHTDAYGALSYAAVCAYQCRGPRDLGGVPGPEALVMAWVEQTLAIWSRIERAGDSNERNP
jgi:hypothetical protein